MAPLELIQQLDRALPQTQCTRCGFPDCLAYATAIAAGEAEINQCPPGGAEGVQRLATITGRAALPLSATHGAEGPRRLAVIDEAWCIGCTLCLKACPVDAIAGASKQMHVVVNEQCTGCELCIPVCPVDCISLEDTGPATGWTAWSQAQADAALERYRVHQQRATAPEEDAAPEPEAPVDSKRAAIAAAMARARAKSK